ncbi:MAG: hypothetical protein KIH08_00620 [Candidatus Freyarchaeota archaeon]|nr:hypothetical protein [Candidatus Jordarchaeia archaeon]MBS7268334.1 hypothetical protein [Candidatus Jordarchaeia archaeon]MBS7278491.1 hypothetical protein [Candidatus Jordarchaeia archaeon]
MSDITEEVLSLVVAATLASQGYYVCLQPEVLGKRYKPSVAAIKPTLSELKKRVERGVIPPEIVYYLDDELWTGEANLLSETKEDRFSFREFLDNSTWVEKRIDGESVYLRLRDYHVPSRECVMVNCGFGNPIRAVRTLRELRDCCNRAYLVFPFYVDEDFLDHCVDSGVGFQVFHREVGLLKEIVPAEFEEAKNRRSFRYLCEFVLRENLRYRVGEK